MVEKRDIILEAAEELFAEHGFEGTSTRMLASKAGVNVAMISYYFGSKEKLFEEMIEARIQKSYQKLQSINEEKADPWEKIDNVIDMYVERIVSNHKFHRILFRELTLEQRTETSKIVHKRMIMNMNEVKKIILDGQKAGYFKDVDVELTIASLLGTITNFTFTHRLAVEMMGGNPDKENVEDKSSKDRLKKHLRDLMYSHLKK